MARDSWLKRLIWLRGSPAGGSGASYEKTVGPAPIISISDAKPKPAKSLIVGMEPIQAGSGDPSPDNIRPITGRTGVTVERTGKNLFGPNASPTANAYIGVNGNLGYATGWIVSDYIAVPPDTELYFQPNSTVGDSAKTWFYDAEQNPISYISSGQCSFTTPSNCAFMRFSYRSASTDIMLNLGSTASAFEPYQGATYPVSWQTEAGTVYGGTVDLVSGEGRVVGQPITADASRLTRVARNNADTGTVYRTDAAVGGINMNLFSNHGILASELLKIVTSANVYMPVYSVKLYINYLYICIPDDDIDAAKAWVTANPVNVVATLKDPVPFDFTPTQIQLLKNENVLWSDADDLTLTYIGTTPPNLLGGGYNPPAEQDPEELTEPEATETDEPAEETPAEEGENNGE